MKRDLYNWLQIWGLDKKRKPLVIRGARQVGKTWLINYFGMRDFKNYVEINFELQPQYKSCFSTLDPIEIIKKVELSANVDIFEGETLLFLDEIQECPQALESLRYFYEKIPNLHIIGAGSLLEFIMRDEQISIPMGRIQNIHMLPLSFGEFLSARGEDKIRYYLKNIALTEQIPEPVDQKCVGLLRDYLYLGGMPEAVADYLERDKFSNIDMIHQGLLQNYKQDFGKYSRQANATMLKKIFTKAPGMVGNKFKYAQIDQQHNSRDIKKSLELLVKAHILHKINSASGAGLPLPAHSNEKYFKVLFLDVGLLQSCMGITRETFLADNLLAVYKGLVAEQLIGQELLTLREYYEEPLLFYWHREARGSNAEVDYLWQKNSLILPVEVKAGKTGTLKSLRLFLAEKKASFGIRFSLHPLSFTDSVLSIPLYAVEAMPGLIEQLRQ